jgi:hypothetical protein
LPGHAYVVSVYQVIEEVDEALRALVRREALNGSDVDVAFDAPSKDWAARRNAPTVDLYLYDVREDMRRRDYVWELFRDQAGLPVEKRLPPRRFKLSYMVTAWTQRPEDEHRILSAVLACAVRHEAIPEEFLPTVLRELGIPIYMTIALPPPPERSIGDIWSALGGELKPSLDLVVTSPVTVADSPVIAPVVREEPRLRVTRPEAEVETAREGRRRGAAAKPAATAEEVLEQLSAGSEASPGRIIRVRPYHRR